MWVRMPPNKRQHTVPKFYLRLFSSDPQGKVICVFNIPTGRYISGASLGKQAYADYFYGKDRDIEDALGAMEGQAARIIAGVQQDRRMPEVTTKEYKRLLEFILYLRLRTTYAAECISELTEKFGKAIHSRFEASTELLDNIKNEWSYPSQVCLAAIPEHVLLAEDLACRLLINATHMSFVTSDNPVVFYNQLMEKKKAPGSCAAISWKGLQIFVPLTEQHYLAYYDPVVYDMGASGPIEITLSEPNDVMALNKLQFINANENIYCSDHFEEHKLRTLHRKSMPQARSETVTVREYPEMDNPNRSLLHLFSEDIRCGLHLSFCRIRKELRQFSLGNKAFHPRNKSLSRLLSEFRELVRKGEYQQHELHRFLKQRTSAIDDQ
jgi:hypothetical protein